MNGTKLPRSESSYTIEVKPRLHATLIGMGANGYRTNGGVGFSINEPKALITGRLGRADAILDLRTNGFNHEEIERILNVISLIKLPGTFVELTIQGAMPTHVGLGSSTAIRLACLEICNCLWQGRYSQEDLLSHSGRGGTSGIGIRTYFCGGLVFDIGVQGGKRHQPSSQSESRRSLPLVMLKSKLPAWKIGLCLPHEIDPLTEDDEKHFFDKTCPISSTSVKDILYEVSYGLVPALCEDDYQTFCSSIKRIQTTEWKCAERALYGAPLVELENVIYAEGADCVGMSSLGPCLFIASKNLPLLIGRLRKIRPDCSWIETHFNNEGRVMYA